MFFLTYLCRELRHRMRQDRGRTRGGLHPPHEHAHPARLPTPASRVSNHTRANPATNTQVSAIRVYKITRSLQLRPYVQHSDVLGSPGQGPLEASAVAAIARLPDVGAAAGGLVLTEIKTTIPADNMPPPSSFQPPSPGQRHRRGPRPPRARPAGHGAAGLQPGLRAGPVHSDGPRPGAGQARRPGQHRLRPGRQRGRRRRGDGRDLPVAAFGTSDQLGQPWPARWPDRCRPPRG
jgi:hypothetical protein